MDQGLGLFVISAMAVSLSGVLSPGPMTAAAITHGSRSRMAGIGMSIGHAVVEVPLIILIYLGASRLFQGDTTRVAVGMLGGIYLLQMGADLIRSISANHRQQAHGGMGPVMTGIALSAGNPYFLLWWATIGLGLVIGAEKYGIAGIAVFIVAHLFCDLVWLTLLTMASYKGMEAFGTRLYRTVCVICGLTLLGFGGAFVRGAFGILTG